MKHFLLNIAFLAVTLAQDFTDSQPKTVPPSMLKIFDSIDTMIHSINFNFTNNGLLFAGAKSFHLLPADPLVNFLQNATN